MHNKISGTILLDSYLENFNGIDLEELNKASLMDRVDKKFVISNKQLLDILPHLQKHFDVLEISGSKNQYYTSYYYDTERYDMYMSHHNKRVNRYKIRQRFYHTTGDSFLEIKYKNNKGLTKKRRIETDDELKVIPSQYVDFVQDNSRYNPLKLQRIIKNSFNRITLTNKRRDQRITIDTNLQYEYKGEQHKTPNLVIVEVKSTRFNVDQTIFNLFRENRILPTGMSKYSIGFAMLNPDLKQNLFKQKINTINKLIHAI